MQKKPGLLHWIQASRLGKPDYTLLQRTVAGDHLPSISAEKGVRLLTGRALHVQRIDSLAKAEPDYYHPLVILKVGAHAPIWNRVEELSGLWSCSIFFKEKFHGNCLAKGCIMEQNLRK